LTPSQHENEGPSAYRKTCIPVDWEGRRQAITSVGIALIGARRSSDASSAVKLTTNATGRSATRPATTMVAALQSRRDIRRRCVARRA